MPSRNVLLIGASAGGVEALRTLVAELPADLPAAVLVVLHVPASGHSALPRILERSGSLPCEHAVDGEPLRTGRIYVAPPDRHLILLDDVVHLSRGPRENGYRPAVDVLFRTAARELTSRVVATVLSGTLDDGTAGVRTVQTRGGLVLIQDPDDAVYPGMPQNALNACHADFVGTAQEIGKELARLSGSLAPEWSAGAQRELRMETDMARLDQDTLDDLDRPGTPSGFSCPDCQGSLFELTDHHLRFRCRVGHAWTAVSLLAQQDAGLEHALWMALRSLEEKAALARRMAHAARLRNSARGAMQYDESADAALAATGTLRELLLGQPAQVSSDLTESVEPPPDDSAPDLRARADT